MLDGPWKAYIQGYLSCWSEDCAILQDETLPVLSGLPRHRPKSRTESFFGSKAARTFCDPFPSAPTPGLPWPALSVHLLMSAPVIPS